MKNIKHCEVCDLQSFNVNKGITCSLTNEKATFIKKCPDIKLDKNLKESLIKINKEFNNSKYLRKLALGNMFFYGVIGISVLYFCYYLSIILLKLGLFHTGTIIIFTIGISIIGMGIGALNYSKQKRNVINPKKQILDKLTVLYNIKYEFESDISTDLMGLKHTKTKLKLNGVTHEKVEQY